MGVNNQEKKCHLASQVLRACRNQLFFEHRFLEQALFRFRLQASDEIWFGSDGSSLFFQPEWILEQYRTDKTGITRRYLHTVLHFLYLHPFFAAADEQIYWDLAADLCVEKVLQAGGFVLPQSPDDVLRGTVLGEMENACGSGSVRNVFLYLRKRYSYREVLELAALFRLDDHRLWYARNIQSETCDSVDTELSEAESEPGGGREGDFGTGRTERSLSVNGNEVRWQEVRQSWKDAAERTLMNIQAGPDASTESQRGDMAGEMVKNLQLTARETCDYRLFLKKFAVMEEAMQLDHEEFDYIYYTLGLNLYKKVPLIEPLEYKEVQVIREFVIVIDTSGSCDGELVERFLIKTCNILRQTERFSRKVNIHVIQCDCAIQDDVKITSLEALEQYTGQFTIKGLGGTDFRPPFHYVNRMLENGEMNRVDGLLYFTDGDGIFPVKPPKYKTAFVFVDKENEIKVPAWAMKVYIDEEELR